MRYRLHVAAMMALALCGGPCLGQTASTFTLGTTQLDFHDHDIGSSTPGKVMVTSSSTNAINLVLKTTGANPGDFVITSSCLSNLQPQSKCEVDVTFSPVPPPKKTTADDSTTGDQAKPGESANQATTDGAWPVDRKATLEISDGKNPAQSVSVSGRAFENVAVSSIQVSLRRPGDGSIPAQPLIVTNYTHVILAKVAVTLSDGFIADPAACVDVPSRNPCTVYISLASTAQSPRNGSLALTGTLSSQPAPSDPPPTLTHIVMLRKARPHWYSSDQSSDGIGLLILVSFFYFLGLVLVRWHMIAKPARSQVAAEIEAVRARVTADATCVPDSTQKRIRLQEIYALLETAAFPFKHKRFRDTPWFVSYNDEASADPPGNLAHGQYPWLPTRMFNAVFWTRGQELAAWSLCHEAEVEFVPLLPPELVRARLETAEQELRQINTPVSLALADRIVQALTSGEAVIVEQARHLLQLVLGLIEPINVPQAAGDALVADLRQLASAALQKFATAITAAANPAGDLPACKSALEAAIAAANECQKFSDYAAKVLTVDTLPQPAKDLLNKLPAFLAKLKREVDAAKAAPAPDANACKAALDGLKPVAAEAGALADELKAPKRDANQDTPWQCLRKLCESQVSVTMAMTQATTPSAGLKLLQQVLENIANESDAVLNVSHSDAAGMAEGIRDEVVQLAKLGPWKAELVSQIKATVTRDVAAPVERWRAILIEALGQVYGNLDEQYFQVTSWHNKLIWLVGCALLFIVALGLTLPTPLVLLIGAIGGLLSRLQRSLKRPKKGSEPTEPSWGSMFLSPLIGAFCGWGGILLVILGLKFNLFGSALTIDWQNQAEPVTMAIALLFGFSERLFSGIAKKLEQKIEEPSSAAAKAPAPAAKTTAPAIASINPPSVPFGQQQKLTLTGLNFSPTVKVGITDQTGTSQPQSQARFVSATSIELTYSPPGTKAYSATVSVTNPDGQTATATLNIAAPAG